MAKPSYQALPANGASIRLLRSLLGMTVAFTPSSCVVTPSRWRSHRIEALPANGASIRLLRSLLGMTVVFTPSSCLSRRVDGEAIVSRRFLRTVPRYGCCAAYSA
uniref:Uncharacterized protein n=1 Tax=mine drainage metagenome TaxID=410659 RepID=E6PDD4_9ZZZZ